MLAFINGLTEDRSGAAVVEYGLIVALVSIGMFVALEQLGVSIIGIYGVVAGTLDAAG